MEEKLVPVDAMMRALNLAARSAAETFMGEVQAQLKDMVAFEVASKKWAPEAIAAIARDVMADADLVDTSNMTAYVATSIKEATDEDALRSTVENIFEGIKDSRSFKNCVVDLIDAPDVEEAIKAYFEDNTFSIGAP